MGQWIRESLLSNSEIGILRWIYQICSEILWMEKYEGGKNSMDISENKKTKWTATERRKNSMEGMIIDIR